MNGAVTRLPFMGCDGAHPNVICPTDPRLQNSLAQGWLKYLPNSTSSFPLNNYQPPAQPAFISSNANFHNIRLDEYVGSNDHFTLTRFKRDNLPQTSHFLPIEIASEQENTSNMVEPA